jgi:hypothetical protein
MPNSSRFARSCTLTLRVLGGKSGKIAARNGNEMARLAAKTTWFGADVGVFTLPRARLRVGEMGVGWANMWLSRCWRGAVAVQ